MLKREKFVAKLALHSLINSIIGLILNIFDVNGADIDAYV